MSVDPLAGWWRHQITIARYTGTGAYGDVWDSPTTELGAIEDRRRMIRSSNGQQAVSSTTVYLPLSTPDVPLGSNVTLPAAFGARVATVLQVSRHDGGGQPTPDHLEIALT